MVDNENVAIKINLWYNKPKDNEDQNMNSIFNKYYNDEVFDVEGIRKSPLTQEELKNEGLNEEDIQNYFQLVKALYCECLLFDIQPSIVKETPNIYKSNISTLFMNFLSFCSLKGLVAFDLYKDLLEDYQRYHIIMFNHLFVDFYRYPNFETEARLQSIEEFRLKLEENLIHKTEDWYLILRYGIHICFDSQDETKQTYLCRYSSIDKKMLRLSYKESDLLLHNIKEDLGTCEQKEKELLKDYQVGKYEFRKHNLIDQLNELYREKQWLEECEEIIEEKIEEFKSIICVDKEILYIYKDTIICHKNKHDIIQATAILNGKT